jgi:hypothetical protein
MPRQARQRVGPVQHIDRLLDETHFFAGSSGPQVELFTNIT